MKSHTNINRIAVNVEDLYNIVKEMKDAGEKVAFLEICEPIPDIELGKHLQFEAYGTACGGAVDYEYIEEVTEEEKQVALWSDTEEDDSPEGYREVASIEITTE